MRGIGEGLLYDIGEITSVFLLERCQAFEIGACKLHACPPAGLQLITETTERQLRQVFAIQLDFQDFSAKRRHLIWPFAGNIVRTSCVHAMTKLAPYHTKRACCLRLPKYRHGFRPLMGRRIENDATVREPEREQQEVDVQIVARLKGEAGRFHPGRS